MGFQIWLMGFWFLACFFSCRLICVTSQSVGESNGSVKGTVFIDGRSSIGKTDKDFICATLDWWPPEKCDYGTCSWNYASLINLDLNNNILLKAVKAFSPLKIRLGGTLQDKVIYDTKDNDQPCVQFVRDKSEMFGFTQGCLPMYRWDELNAFFKKADVKVIFGLNALSGRSIQSDGSVLGDWDYTNAESFISYTVKKNYTMYGWELGNELSGNGIGATITADQYASDMISLYKVVKRVYSNVASKPIILGPAGFYDANWFKDFLDKTGNSLDAITHHIYNLGPGVDEHLIEKILDPSYLDGEANTFSGLQSTIMSSATSPIAWVGEAGGAYNSGRNNVSNTFVYSFWYLDQLGMSSAYDTKTYCRQSLIGGNYGLLDTTTFVPNPDYYSALLWHRLMGRNVLSTSFSGINKIRAYAHCAKQSEGVTLLLINLDNTTTISVNVFFNSTWKLHHKHKSRSPHSPLRVHLTHRAHRSHKTTKARLPRASASTMREEYHLTAKDGDLQSRTMLLNGNILTVNSSGDIPPLEPVHVNSSTPIEVAPFSIVFAHLPYVLPACK